jgi:hypothetical protein
MLWTEEERLAEESEELESSSVGFVTEGGKFTGKTVFIPGDIGFDMIAPETLTRIIEDCAGFELSNLKILDQCGNKKQNGHDFWLTRNRHGAGFWDRGYGEAGKQITEVCRKFGEVNVYLGDDGKIYHE